MDSDFLAVLIVVGLTLAAFLLSLYFFQLRLRKPEGKKNLAPTRTVQDSVHAAAASAPAAPVRFDDLRSTEMTFYRLALNIPEYDAPEAHEQIARAIANSISAALTRPEYLPRRPLLIPKLMRALNDDDSTRDDLSRIILQDPVLSGDVLQRANSSYYRIWAQPVETIDRALRLLGADGLKAVLATSVMRPVFNTPQTMSPVFSTLVWERALRSAEAAGLYAEKTRSGDRFSAHLLGLLSALGTIALFRLSLDVYTEFPDYEVRANTVLAVLGAHDLSTSKLIAQRWELADSFQDALQEQLDETPNAELSALGKALHCGRLCGTLSLLQENGLASDDECRQSALHLGLPEPLFDSLWSVIGKAPPEGVAESA